MFKSIVIKCHILFLWYIVYDLIRLSIIAKNYLTKEELKSLERIVTMYLDYAEDQAERHIPMIMEELEE